MQNFSSPEFLNKVKALDKSTLSILVDVYTGHLFKAGLGVGLSEEMAYDLANSTWLTFFEVVPRFEGRSHIRTFLFGIFYNKLSELKRANFKFLKTDPIEEVIESKFSEDGHWNVQFNDPSDFLQGREVVKIIEECLEHLPLLQKSAFHMKVVQEEESSVVCGALNISEVNLRQLIFRAKAKMRVCVEKNLK